MHIDMLRLLVNGSMELKAVRELVEVKSLILPNYKYVYSIYMNSCVIIHDATCVKVHCDYLMHYIL